MNCYNMQKNRTLARIFNTLPYNQPVDIYGDGILIFSDLKYKEFTPYVYTLEGLHKIDIYKAGSKENPIIRTAIRLPLDQIFTIAITGNEKEETLLVIDEDIEQEPSKDSAIGRVVNLSPGLPVVDIFVNGSPSINNIDFRDQTPYVYIPPGIYTTEVRTSQDGSDVASDKFEFKTNRIYTSYIIGNPPNVEILNSVDGNTYVCRT